MGLFKRKSKMVASPAALELPVLHGTADAELQRKLSMEIRHCPTCRYEVTNPMNERCPRCFAVVPLSEHTNCGECSHQGNCAHALPS